MGIKNEQVDAYIEKSAPFARPILKHVRSLVHRACPGVVEAIKWSFPNFNYKGSILCSMAAFKQHCTFGFWLSAQMQDPENILATTGRDSMGNLGHLRSVDDLPKDDILIQYLKHAMTLIESGVKLAKKQPAAAAKIIEIPDYFTNVLATNEKARLHFESFAYSHKKEYIEWISEAKTEATRNKRIATALEWIAEGKGRNWKYERN
jgi:uncharacterized protein YdeI (YjbR/CyaY-like superfamily)